MPSYTEMKKDFVIRTNRLLSQYDQYILGFVDEEHKAEVTLLINCLLGLLIFPKETHNDYLWLEPHTNELICNLDENIWGINSTSLLGAGVRPSKSPKRDPNSKEDQLINLVDSKVRSLTISDTNKQVKLNKKRNGTWECEETEYIQLTPSNITLKDFIKQLRDTAAHADFREVPSGRKITTLAFGSEQGFNLKIKPEDLRKFVGQLALIAGK